jgi:PAS domain S-box-containing protein
VSQTGDSHSAWPALRFRLPLEPARLLRARERVRDYLRLLCTDADAIDDIVFCVTEACTNVIRHSGAVEDMDVAVQFTGDAVVTDVVDKGRGFDVASRDLEEPPDLLEDSGRGLFLISQLMDELEVSSNGGVHLHMARRGLHESCVVTAFDAVEGDLRPVEEHRETRLRALLEEIDEGFLAMDWQYRYVYVNRVALEIIGTTREELIGRTPFEVWPELEGTSLALHYREAMELGKPSVFERLSPVTHSWLETRVYPTSGGISAYLRRIDERKRVEREREHLIVDLRRSERRLRATFEQAAVGVYHVGLDGRYLRVNERFCQLLGYTREELEGSRVDDVTHPDDLEEQRRLVKALSEGTASSASMDKRYLRSDGTEIWASLTMSLVRAEEGEPTYVVGIVQDITERKESEPLLRRYELLWGAAPDVMLFVRRSDAHIVEANRAAEVEYGYGRDRLLELTLFDLAVSEDGAHDLAQLERAAHEGILFESLHRRADGSAFPVEVSARGVLAESGEEVILSVVRNVSERRASDRRRGRVDRAS